MHRVSTVPLDNESFPLVKFGSEELENLIKECHPDLIIFDPLQSFIPSEVNMGARNQMRECLAHLIAYGERYGTTSLVLCHTNKRPGASGRDRVADSADLWDISRSVLIAGWSDVRGVKYLSHEKSNYSALNETLLFSTTNETITVTGRTENRDAFFVAKASRGGGRTGVAQDEAREVILKALGDGEMPVTELDETVLAYGVSKTALRRAKESLKDDGTISMRITGNGKGSEKRMWFVKKNVSSVRDSTGGRGEG